MDVLVLRIGVLLTGVVCCLCVGGIILLASLGHDTPPTLATIAGTSVGALVGILVNPGKAVDDRR